MSFPKNALSGARLALAAWLSCTAFTAQAGDKTVLRPTLDVDQSWDSNIYNTSGDEDGSLVTRITPSLWLENQGELGSARLGLSGVARNIWKDSELSGIDGMARGEFDRKVTPRLTLLGNGLLEHYSGYDEIDPDGLNQGDQPILSEQPSWNRDQIGAGFRYLLTERLTLSLSGSAGRVNYESLDVDVTSEGDYRDRSLLNGGSSLRYQLTALDQLLLDVNLDNTSYQELATTGSNDSMIWSSQVGWARNWTQFWSSTAKIGLRSIDTTLKNVPQNGGYSYYEICGVIFGFDIPCPGSGAPQSVELGRAGFSNTGTGLIGSLSIRRSFARSALELSYDRTTRSTGGSGKTNFDIDSFTLSWTQRLAERVKLSLSGNYSLYHSVTDEIPNYAASVIAFPDDTALVSCGLGGAQTVSGFVTNPYDPTDPNDPTDLPEQLPVFQCVGGSSEEKREYTTLVGRIDWQLRRKLTAYVTAKYYRSIADQSAGSFGEIRTEDLDKFTFGVGFRYFYDLGL